MARRAKPKAPPDDAEVDGPAADDVFDTAAPPPPQAYAKRVPKSQGPPAAPPASPGQAPAQVPSVDALAAAGPWYTLGLGGALLAQSPLLFALAVLLTYSFLAGLAAFLLWLLLSWLLADCGTACDLDCGCGDCGCCCEGGCSCDDCCSDDGGTNTTSGGDKEAPAPGVAMAAGGLAAALGLRRLRGAGGRAFAHGAMAHHPDLPKFRADVVRWAGERYCVGCVTVYPVFVVVTAGLLAAGSAVVAWPAALAAGLALATVQGVSALGLARRRAAKVAVKASLGAGLALAVQGILWAPWPRLLQAAGLALLLALAFASARPRRRRIGRALAARRLA